MIVQIMAVEPQKRVRDLFGSSSDEEEDRVGTSCGGVGLESLPENDRNLIGNCITTPELLLLYSVNKALVVIRRDPRKQRNIFRVRQDWQTKLVTEFDRNLSEYLTWARQSRSTYLVLDGSSTKSEWENYPAPSRPWHGSDATLHALSVAKLTCRGYGTYRTMYQQQAGAASLGYEVGAHKHFMGSVLLPVRRSFEAIERYMGSECAITGKRPELAFQLTKQEADRDVHWHHLVPGDGAYLVSELMNEATAFAIGAYHSLSHIDFFICFMKQLFTREATARDSGRGTGSGLGFTVCQHSSDLRADLREFVANCQAVALPGNIDTWQKRKADQAEVVDKVCALLLSFFPHQPLPALKHHIQVLGISAILEDIPWFHDVPWFNAKKLIQEMQQLIHAEHRIAPIPWFNEEDLTLQYPYKINFPTSSTRMQMSYAQQMMTPRVTKLVLFGKVVVHVAAGDATCYFTTHGEDDRCRSRASCTKWFQQEVRNGFFTYSGITTPPVLTVNKVQVSPPHFRIQTDRMCPIAQTWLAGITGTPAFQRILKEAMHYCDVLRTAPFSYCMIGKAELRFTRERVHTIQGFLVSRASADDRRIHGIDDCWNVEDCPIREYLRTLRPKWILFSSTWSIGRLHPHIKACAYEILRHIVRKQEDAKDRKRIAEQLGGSHPDLGPEQLFHQGAMDAEFPSHPLTLQYQLHERRWWYEDSGLG
jgi:hypothetical protein